ncbi:MULTISPECIES: UDP-N-acetylmuramoyl-tripeptide--D-alanyl-D-alanine ligase [unclassified Desulfurobacterium]|uniref:UDP-N-acetylmuramoyl-tripeptide--D-alanyl-D- alanine ligase n=1 Tax=Desulfurobacterium sp. TC5-1 TaxID=1158318 RepID=UPI0003B33939|nr:UDP-N-acetylmuramoyl-tripeptide--D-alanyl-D-alanine ligase [Desulfurobacterium sp. TC5-1]
MKLKEIANITGGTIKGNLNVNVERFEFDSRKVTEKTLFIPLKGNRDGHNFIDDAAKRGAAATLSEKELKPILPTIHVENTMEAFKKIALHKREIFSGNVIGITGSVGKTTTKELLTYVLSKFSTVHSNVESYNNLLGITHTLANLKKCNVYIQEIGTNSPGEVATLTEMVKPHIGVVTAVEPGHLEGFKTFENLLKEKFSLIENTEVKIAPSHLAKEKNILTFGKGGTAEIIEAHFYPEKTLFTAKINSKTVNGQVNIPGRGILNAILITLLIGNVLNIPPEEIVEIVKTFKPPKWRMEIVKLGSITLIRDYYNANPASMKNAIDVLSLYETPKVAVLGEMLELGNHSEKLHRDIGKYLSEKGIEEALFFGKNSVFYLSNFNGRGYHFNNRDEFLQFLKTFDFSGKTVLIKGSRGNKLEEVETIIRERFQ